MELSKLEQRIKAASKYQLDAAQPVLILTIGLPRSGKTTWAMQQGVPVVCPDAIRMAIHGLPFCFEAEPWVWLTAKTMVKALFLAGHFVVILDATNTMRERRADWNSPRWRTCCKLFDVPGDICIQRATDSNKPELIQAILNMNRKFEDVDLKTETFLESLYGEEDVPF